MTAGGRSGHRPCGPALLRLLTGLVLVAAGCGTDPGAAAGSITVAAAASLTVPFRAVGDGFERAHPGSEVVFTFDSSGTLAEQIRAGAPADVFASADETTMTGLVDAGLVAGRPVRFARNRLAIVVRRGNPTGIRSLADLAAAGTVALCGPDAPCGRYGEQVLGAAGVTLPPEGVTRGRNARATLAAVAEGDADAAIVYATDAGDERVEAVPIPDAQNAVADFPVAVVAATINRSTAEAFVAYVSGPDGQRVLRAAGFGAPG